MGRPRRAATGAYPLATPITTLETPSQRNSEPLHRVLSGLVFLTLATAPNEGYLQAVNGNLGKLAPAALFLAWVAHLFQVRRIPRLTSVSLMSVGLLVAVLVSGAVNSSGEFVLLYTARWAPFLILTVALIDLLSTVVDVRVAVVALVVGATVSGLGALYSFVVLHDARASGPLQDPNDLAYVLVTALPFALITTQRVRSSTTRLAGAFAAVVLVAGAATTLSRGGLIAALLLLIWALARRLISGRVLLVVACLVAVGSFLAVTQISPQIQSALSQKSYIAQANVDSRELRWEAAARMLAERPAFGVGPGGVRENYVAASGNAELVEQDPVTHNMYLEVGAELGLVGLGLFLCILLMAVTASERAYREGDRLALAAQGSLLAVCVASVFLSEEYYMALWAAVSISAALELRLRENR